MDQSDKYFDLYKKLYSLKGQKIRFHTKLGIYEGYIDYLLPLNRSVSFKNVYCLPDKEYAGCLRFLLEDFISYKPIEPEGFEKYEKWDYLAKILDNTSVGPTYKITDIHDDLESIKSENEEEEEIEEEKFVLELPSELEEKLPKESAILDKIDSDFKSAVRSISQEIVIGVSFAGPRISRIGQLSWITISIPQHTFLFDIQLLGNSAFNEGLRDILQDQNIQKVIHDCRKPSDCLYHLFATKLENVFDTQVADYVVNTQRYKGKEPFKYVSSLDCCLVNHLEVPKEFLINRKENYSYRSEVNFFHVRPLSNEYRAVLIKNVIYLRLLKEKLTNFMFSTFQTAVNIHLGVLADAAGPEFLRESHNPDEISPAVLMHGIQAVRYDEKVKAPPIPLVCKFKDSQKGSLIPYNTASKNEGKEVCPTVDNVLEIEVEKSVNRMDPERKCKANPLVSGNPLVSNDHDVGDSFNISNSRRHIDDVYHKLVNSLQNSEVLRNNINVKPSSGTSKLFIKKSSVNTVPQQRLEIAECDKQCKSDEQNSVSEIASGIKRIPVSRNIKTLLKFQKAARAASRNTEKLVASGSKLNFVPAGMGC